MTVVKRWNKLFKERMQKIIFRIKLQQMNRRWYYTGASSWELFPPSFYYTHSEEEIEHITEETVRRIQELIDKLK